MFTTPVLFIIFNRPSTTQLVFSMLSKVQPRQLFIAGDGPRADKIGEEELCIKARQNATSVDWDCEVHTLFQDQNLGCGLGPSSAITWFFENVEEGIILEDDCLPSYSFFQFCSELLDYYRDNPKVMHISGNNFQYGHKRGNASYYFSRYTHNWGWATWRRAWRLFDFSLVSEQDRYHIWDKQWELSVNKQAGVSILPNKNLVKNIGFGPEATHTKNWGRYSILNAEEISFPLTHPVKYNIDKQADKFTEYSHFHNVPQLNLIWYYQIKDSSPIKSIRTFVWKMIFFFWEKIPLKIRKRIKNIIHNLS